MGWEFLADFPLVRTNQVAGLLQVWARLISNTTHNPMSILLNEKKRKQDLKEVGLLTVSASKLENRKWSKVVVEHVI